MIKKLIILIFLTQLFSCAGKHKSDAQRASIGEKPSIPNLISKDTLLVDLNRSTIHWKGTKMKGTGKHEGIIKIQNAYFLLNGSQLSGGYFIIDMNTIEVTDIPNHEPVPRKRLNDHLKSDVFFDVQNHPTAHLEISKVEPTVSDSLKIKGNLNIKDITKNIEFLALYKNNLFSTKFIFDRFQWNIAYEGNWIDKNLVDREIELDIKLKTK